MELRLDERIEELERDVVALTEKMREPVGVEMDGEREKEREDEKKVRGRRKRKRR